MQPSTQSSAYYPHRSRGDRIFRGLPEVADCAGPQGCAPIATSGQQPIDNTLLPAQWLRRVSCRGPLPNGKIHGGCNPHRNRSDDRLAGSRPVITPGLKPALMVKASDRVLPRLRKVLLEQD